MERGSLLRAFRRFWKLELVVILVMVALLGVPAVLASSRYQSVNTVSVLPSAEAPAGSSLGATGLIVFEMPAIRSEVIGRSYAATVRSALQLPSTRSWSTAATITPSSGILRVVVTSADRDLVRPVADEYARQLARSVPKRRALSVTTLEQASGPAKTAPKPVRGVATGLALGVILALGLALVLDPVSRDDPRRGRTSRRSTRTPTEPARRPSA